MRAHEIRAAVELSMGDSRSKFDLNLALLRVLPILRQIAKRQWFWLKWGMKALIKAIEKYLKEEDFQV